MFQRFKRAICRMLGVKTRPYLTPSKLPEGPIIESLTPSTMLHRRKPEQVRLPSIRDVSPRSEPVYERTWPDPFREQRPTRYDPDPRPALRLVEPLPPLPRLPARGPSSTPMEIVFAAGVLGAAIGAVASNDAPPLPEPAPAPEAEVFTPRVFEAEPSSSSSDDSSSSSSD